jgi:hypothetical protein
MTDPHVEALFYRIEHSDSVDYAKTPPLELPEPKFTIRIKNEWARIDMRDHYSAEQDARDVVEPFLRLWELSAALNRNPGEWQFVYDRANVINRNPAPGASSGLSISISGVKAHAQARYATYPPPPVGMERDAAVGFMFHQYCMLCEGRTKLSDAANCCLTMLEFRAGNRKEASHHRTCASRVISGVERRRRE